jgi:hypothetical protein
MDDIFHEHLIALAEARGADDLHGTLADHSAKPTMAIQPSRLWLDPIPVYLHHMAIEALQDRDAIGFLCRAANDHGLDLVDYNKGVLLGLGIYEEALLHAFTNVRTNTLAFPLRRLRLLFWQAKLQRLRKAGDPFPVPGPYTLYRGVAGRGTARRIRGLAWTSSEEVAWWFARRYDSLPRPAVYRAIVPKRYIYAYTNDRQEQEYICLLPDTFPVKRVTEGQPQRQRSHKAAPVA